MPATIDNKVSWSIWKSENSLTSPLKSASFWGVVMLWGITMASAVEDLHRWNESGHFTEWGIAVAVACAAVIFYVRFRIAVIRMLVSQPEPSEGIESGLRRMCEIVTVLAAVPLVCEIVIFKGF